MRNYCKLESTHRVQTSANAVRYLKTYPSNTSRRRLCVILCVCLHDKTKTVDCKITKLATGIVHAARYLAHQSSKLDQKVKGQGHRLTKCKNILKAIE